MSSVIVRFLLALSLIVAVIIVDRYSKILAVMHLWSGPYAVMPSLDFRLAYNAGTSFSLLAAANSWQRYLLIGLSSLISVALCVWLYRLPAQQKIKSIAVSLIIGGAVGNLWDRISLGYVIDFIYFYIGSWSWPTFNVADSAICTGVLLLIYCMQKEK